MKDNEKYSFKDTDDGQIITFEKGCMVDAETLFNEIFGSSFMQQKFVIIDEGKPTDFQKKNVLKMNKKVTVEIKSITKKYKKS